MYCHDAISMLLTCIPDSESVAADPKDIDSGESSGVSDMGSAAMDDPGFGDFPPSLLFMF